jgi:cyclic pyranopterin monophosphate synthase
MLSHVDSANRPTMVDVGDKAVTTRTAVARAVVVFPADVIVRSGDVLRTKKGPVFDTAVIAGVMAAKRTHELIPFCHPIGLEDCKIAIDWGEANEVVIECAVRATHKTGVEMEALTGAAVAALTVYDMCKALTHGIEIREVVLLAKSGGKRGFERNAATAAAR